MKQMEKLRHAFADSPPAISLIKVENARYYPKSFGNEKATPEYGSLKMHFIHDRGAVCADILISVQPNKLIDMVTLAQRFGFVAKSGDPGVNLREFYRRYERRLLKLGDALE